MYESRLFKQELQTVYYAKDYKNNTYAIELFEQAGVEVLKYRLTREKSTF